MEYKWEILYLRGKRYKEHGTTDWEIDREWRNCHEGYMGLKERSGIVRCGREGERSLWQGLEAADCFNLFIEACP